MWHMTSPILIDIPEEVIGFRVLLRPYRPEDAAALWEAIQESREHLAPWMPWVHDYHSLDVAQAYVGAGPLAAARRPGRRHLPA